MKYNEECDLFIRRKIKEALCRGEKISDIASELPEIVKKVHGVIITRDAVRLRAYRISRKLSVNNDQECHYVFVPGADQHLAESRQFAIMAISQLKRIRRDDPHGTDALKLVTEWIVREMIERATRGSWQKQSSEV